MPDLIRHPEIMSQLGDSGFRLSPEWRRRA